MTRLRTYEWVPSERMPSTADHVATMIGVHWPDARTAIDTTPGKRCFWSGQHPPGRLIVTFSEHDVRCLPYDDLAFDLGICDLPHLSGLGTDSLFVTRYGTVRDRELEPLIRQGVRETWRIARIGVLIKVTSHVHRGQYQDLQGWVTAELGTPYARCYAVHLPIGRRTEPQLSADSNGAEYLIFRRGSQRHMRRSARSQLIMDAAWDLAREATS